MTARLGRNLTVALCLTLQVSMLLGLSCPCTRAEEAGAAELSQQGGDSQGAESCFCLASSDAWTASLSARSDGLVRLVALTTQQTFETDRGALVRKAIDLPVGVLPAPDRAELQVFLE
ncbi:MAG: hypothetical protein U1E05_18570 [Patescibacteria group bacterium]|nr:hypothetical protein [Patescibacteria group bacterium]